MREAIQYKEKLDEEKQNVYRTHNNIVLPHERKKIDTEFHLKNIMGEPDEDKNND